MYNFLNICIIVVFILQNSHGFLYTKKFIQDKIQRRDKLDVVVKIMLFVASTE